MSPDNIANGYEFGDQPEVFAAIGLLRQETSCNVIASNARYLNNFSRMRDLWSGQVRENMSVKFAANARVSFRQ